MPGIFSSKIDAHPGKGAWHELFLISYYISYIFLEVYVKKLKKPQKLQID